MRELTAKEVRKTCDPKKLKSLELADTKDAIILDNERIIDIAEMACNIRTNDHHIPLIIPDGIDGFDLAEKLIARMPATIASNPKDYCYVFNYRRPEIPILIVLPKGMGREFKDNIDALIKGLLLTLPKFNAEPLWEESLKEREYLLSQFNQNREKEKSRSRLRCQIAPDGNERYVSVYIANSGNEIPYMAILSAVPTTPEGMPDKNAALKEYEADKKKLSAGIAELLKLPEKTTKKIVEAKINIIKESIEKLKKQYDAYAKIIKYLKRLEEDIINHLPLFDFTEIEPGGCKPCRQGITEVCKMHSKNGYFSRFAVNLLVDNRKQMGVPVVKVRRATCTELFGIKTEKQGHEELKSYQHTGINPGAFHKANHGYLIVEAVKLSRRIEVLDAFASTLENNEVSIENLMTIIGIPDRSEFLKPENIKLDLKVILILDEWTYQALKRHESWIGLTKFFEVPIRIKPDMPCDAENIDAFRRFLLNACEENNLRKPSIEAQALLVEYNQELIENQEKLNLQTKRFLNTLRQADDFARKHGHEIIEKEDVEKAIEFKHEQHGFFQEWFLDHVKSGRLSFNINSRNKGDINGLFVAHAPDGSAMHGPLRLTCVTGVGKEGLVSIDKNANTDGPQHKKWFGIMSGFITDKLGQKFPPAFTASFVFERSPGVEGPSASGAEACVLLSALSGVPINQRIGITGALTQKGELQTIGGATKKIEGFYEVCKIQGFEPNQTYGVIIPKANAKDLMLKPEIVETIKKGKFHVWAVETVDEAIELLTGVPAGQLQADGTYPEGTIYRLAEDKLRRYAETARNFAKGNTKKKKEK